MENSIYSIFYLTKDQDKLTESEIEFKLPEEYKNYFIDIPIAERVKYLFFNLLFNKIDTDRVVLFLDFYFEIYQQDKRKFLRKIKLDIDEIFESFDIPSREKKYLYSSPYGRQYWDTSKLIISDIMPFFESYDYIKYVNYKRRYKEAIDWINCKMRSISPKKRRDYKSLTRARAFFMAKLHESGKMNLLNGSVLRYTEILEFVADTWGQDQSGKTVYDELNIILTSKNLKQYQKDHKEDFEYGLKLFKDKYSY